jgi:hypothetical protein
VSLLALMAGCMHRDRDRSYRADARPNMPVTTTDNMPDNRATLGGTTRTPSGETIPGSFSSAPIVSGAEANTPTASAVRERLVQEGTIEPTRVAVQDDRGTIYLNGTVDSASQKIRAEQVAMGTPGVASVINQLSVQPGMTMSSTAPMTGDPGACTLVTKIPGSSSEPSSFTRVQVRVYDDPYFAHGLRDDSRVARDSQGRIIREERIVQDQNRVIQEERVVREERPLGDEGRLSYRTADGRIVDAGSPIWSGWLRQGDRLEIHPSSRAIRYDYRFAADDRFHGYKGAWCARGNFVQIP